MRTLPSVMTSLKEQSAGLTPSNVLYKKAISSCTCPPEQTPTNLPRNMKQLRNMRFAALHKSRISSDALYNLHEIAYDLNGFIRSIHTYPDLEVVFGMEEIIQELDTTLALNSKGQLLSYDTTFQLGDFYLSAFLFRHTFFTNVPILPALFMIHERKFTDTHVTFVRILKKLVPQLTKNSQVSIVLDRERAITNAFQKELPSLFPVYCWNHILRDVRRWLSSHGAPSVEKEIYLDHLRQLLHQSNKNAQDALFKVLSRRWDATYVQYWQQNIATVMPQISRWTLEERNIYHPFSGVTNNQSESLNRVIKDLQAWKETPLDCLVLSLYQLQSYYYNEIQRGLAGLGGFQLSPEYKSLSTSPSNITFMNCVAPDDIVERIHKTLTTEEGNVYLYLSIGYLSDDKHDMAFL